MISLFKNKIITGTIILSVIFAPLSYADINNQVINLDVGQWNQVQSIFINGVEIPKARISNSSCLDEKDSKLTVKDYSNKLMNSLGKETQCDLSNLQGNHSEITFNLSCTALDSPFTTQLKMTYQYNREQVRVIGEGTIKGGGTNAPIKIDSVTNRIGPCQS